LIKVSIYVTEEDNRVKMLPLGFSSLAVCYLTSCNESLPFLMNSLHYFYQSLWEHLQTQHKTL